MTERILLVDDEEPVLRAHQRNLSSTFEVDTATSGRAGLDRLRDDGPYAVVVSDMRMPGMDGIAFLAEARELAPDTVRMMLTAFGDVQTAIEAVNEGHVFRFLTKPCPFAIMSRALRDGLEQHRLVMAERELLQQTLTGSVKLLVDLMAVVNEEAFARAGRVTSVVHRLADVLRLRHRWELEVAAMLSQVGCLGAPAGTLRRYVRGERLSPDEQKAVTGHPEVAAQLIRRIPRLEGVADIVALQEKHFDGNGSPAGHPGGESIPVGARILKIALDYDRLLVSGLTPFAALARMRAHVGRYDRDYFVALEDVVGQEPPWEARDIRLDQIEVGMVVAQDVRAADGMVLVSAGQPITQTTRDLLRHYRRSRHMAEPLRVYVVSEPIASAATPGA